MKLPAFLLLACGLSLPALAEKSPQYHGHFLVCANPESTIKMTADLTDGKGEKVATGVLDGNRVYFPELSGGRKRNHFSFYPDKKTPLVVTPAGKTEAEIRLVLAPRIDGGEGEIAGPELLHQRTQPFLYRISRYEALLTLRTHKIIDRRVLCTESQWESD